MGRLLTLFLDGTLDFSMGSVCVCINNNWLQVVAAEPSGLVTEDMTISDGLWLSLNSFIDAFIHCIKIDTFAPLCPNRLYQRIVV